MSLASPSLRTTDPSPRLWNRDEYYAMGDLGFFRDQKVELIGGVIYLHHADAEPTPRRWNRDEYYAMDDRGFFQGQRVQLIGGEVVVLSPQSSRHFLAIEKVADALKGVFADGYWVRTQGPLALGLGTEPEPDVSVVAGGPDDFLDGHPNSAVLAVEVSLSTLAYDQRDKGSLYARAGVADYWVVNLADRRLEVYRDPVADAARPFGFRYERLTVVTPGQTVTPLTKAGAVVAVADLLP